MSNDNLPAQVAILDDQLLALVEITETLRNIGEARGEAAQQLLGSIQMDIMALKALRASLLPRA